METRRSNKQKDKMRRGLRRLFALLLAGAALGLVYCTGGGGRSTAFFQLLGSSPRLVTTMLKSELGYLPEDSGLLEKMDGWQTAVLGESALLRAGESAVTQELAATASPAVSAAVPSGDSESETQTAPPEATQQQNTSNVVERTMKPATGENYSYAGGVYLRNRTKQTVNIAQLAVQKLSLNVGKTSPQVLIIHTHSSEAYLKGPKDNYVESDPSRTENKSYNVIRVGDELTQVLQSQGIGVIHDRALYDYPSYNGSYTRSLAAVKAYLKKYPSITVIFDLHRDALESNDGTVYKVATTINQQKVAQVMLVIGSNDSGLAHPNWKENLKFAIKIQEQMNQDYPSLARPMSLSSSRYNQQMSTGSLLVEIGSTGNSLQEALGGVRLFGNSLAKVLKNLA